MENIIKKITSRKFLMAVVGAAAGLALAFGVEANEITGLVTKIAGVVTMLGSVVTYITAEAKVDAASASCDVILGDIPAELLKDPAE